MKELQIDVLKHCKIEEKYNTKYDIVLMVQGDEPLINHSMIQESISPFYSDSRIDVVNLYSQIEDYNEFNDRNCVKVVVGEDSNALFFSREPIPSLFREKHQHIFKQVCVIPFRRNSYTTVCGTRLKKLKV